MTSGIYMLTFIFAFGPHIEIVSQPFTEYKYCEIATEIVKEIGTSKQYCTSVFKLPDIR